MDGEHDGKQEGTQAQEEQVDTTAQQEASAQVEGGRKRARLREGHRRAGREDRLA